MPSYDSTSDSKGPLCTVDDRWCVGTCRRPSTDVASVYVTFFVLEGNTPERADLEAAIKAQIEMLSPTNRWMETYDVTSTWSAGASSCATSEYSQFPRPLP